MLIIVGDSRVCNLEQALSEMDRKRFHPAFLSKPGARIPHVLEMLNQYKDRNGSTPKMIVIVGLIADVLMKKNGKEYPSFTFREEVYNKQQEYPSLGGAEEMRQNIEDELEGMWPGVRTVWVLPFPVDLATFVRSRSTKPLPRHVECEVNQVSLDFNNYMSAFDKIFQRSAHDMEVIPWFAPWKDVSGQGQMAGATCKFRDFMARLRKGERVSSLYPESSLDGLHPQVRASQALFRIIFRKYKYTLDHSRKSSVTEKPVPSRRDQAVQAVQVLKDEAVQVSIVQPVLKDEAAQTMTTSAQPQKVDQAIQAVPEIESSPVPTRVLDSPVQTHVVLPCHCPRTFVREEEDKFLCNKCQRFFTKEDIYVGRRWFIYMSKDAPSS